MVRNHSLFRTPSAEEWAEIKKTMDAREAAHGLNFQVK